MVLTIPFENPDSFLSNEIGTNILRSLGLKINEKKEFHSVPLLSKDSNTSSKNENILPGLLLKRSEYYEPGWADTRWKYRKNITIDATKVSGDLINFPVLIELYDSDLQRDAQASGNDIMFADDGGSILNHEIEFFTRIYNSTHAHLVAWVRVNLSSSQDTRISMYYGNPTITDQENPTGVWSSNYQAVFHLNDDPTGTVYDSTINDNDGTSSGNMTSSDQTQGNFDGSIDFDGADDLINIGDVNSNSWSGITVQAWIFHDVTGDDRIICKSPTTVTSDHIFSLGVFPDGSNDILRVRLGTDGEGGSPGGPQRDSATNFAIGTWHHLAFTWDSTSEKIYLYIDGSQDSNSYFKDGDSIFDLALPVILANVNTGADNRYFDGKIDEARISNVARSSDWISTEYNNQYDPASFYTKGIKEIYGDISWTENLFRFRKNITINSLLVNGTHTNFPVLIDLFDKDLHNSEKVQPDGNDILFTDAIGLKLVHDIELFDQNYNSTHAHLIAWVKMPTLSNNSDSIITMYYGNPTIPNLQNDSEVWEDYYEGVWHLKESGTGAIDEFSDSSPNNNDGQGGTGLSSETPTRIDGKIGYGQNFDGIDDHISMGTSTTLQPSVITWSSWIKRTGNWTGKRFSLFWTKSVWNGLGWYVQIDDVSSGGPPIPRGLLMVVDGSNFFVFTDTPLNTLYPLNEWVHLAAVFNSATNSTSLYLNGVALPLSFFGTPDTITSNSEPKIMGGNNGEFNGSMDEVHIASVAHSAEWIQTEYTNQLNPSSFYTVTNEEKNQNWWVDGSFNKRRDIVIDHNKVAEDLTDFPILISLTEQGLKSGNIRPDATDLLFVDSEGTKLKHEIEYFSQNTSHGNLIAWVRVPKLSSQNDTIISMYYGNPTVLDQEDPESVWDSDFLAVHHLEESPVGTMYDSSNNDKDLYTVGIMTNGDLVDGYLGEGIDFDNINDGANSSSTITLRSFTFSAWVKFDSIEDWDAVVNVGNDIGSPFRWWGINNGNHALDIMGTTYSFGSLLSTDVWYYISVTYDSLNQSISGYNQGSDEDLYTGVNLGQITTGFQIGMWDGGGYFSDYFDGLIDEVRISNVSRTAGWINTEYENQFNPNSFYSIGPELSLTADITIEETVTAGVENNNQVITPEITGVSGDFYLLSASTKEYQDTTSVTGLGLTWIELEDQPAGRSQTGISVWYATGSNPFTGNVTVTIESSAKALVVQLHRMSGVDVNDPIGITESANTNGENGLGSGGVDDSYPNLDFVTTTPYATIFGTIARRHVVIDTPGSGYTILVESQIGASGDIAGISTEYVTVQNNGSVVVDATLTSDVDWAIVGVEIKPLVPDIFPPIVNDFGVDDPGTGTATFWADIIDDTSMVVSSTIRIDSSEYPMSYNGSYWIYQTPVNYNQQYVYEIVNATDTLGNSLEFPSNDKNFTFNFDSITPTVIDWEYYSDIGPYGTFKANVSDSWGEINSVIVNVTDSNGVPRNDLWAVMTPTASGYMNDTLEMPAGTINFTIIVNDTAGNSFTSLKKQGFVSNNPPVASNVTLSRSPSEVKLPIYSNSTLYLNYSYFDQDADAEDGTEVRWYKNGVLQSAYNDETQIPSSVLVKNDEWNATVRPKDGKDFGTLNNSATIVISNTPPEITSLTIVPLTPTSSNTLSISNNTVDEDNDLIVSYQIRWYINTVYDPFYDDYVSISQSNTTKGEEWYCEMRASDSWNYSSWKQSNIVTIGNTPPTASNLNITMNPITTDDLVADWIYSDVDNDPQNSSWLIRWYKNDVLQPNLNDTKVIQAGNTTKGEVWYYTLQVFDGINYSSIYSLTPNVQIMNAPPEASNLVITTDPKTNESLQADWTYSDIDGDSESNDWIIQWYKNGVHQPAYDNLKTVPSSTTVKGELWNYTLQVSDGTNHSIQYSSPTTTILNTVPEASGITITTDPTSSDAIVASWAASDIDNDNPDDYLNVTIIHWYKWNGTHWNLQATLENSTTVEPGNTTRDEVWYYTVQLFDGEAYSQVYDSSNTTVLNSIPVATNPTFNKTSGVTTTDDFNITYTYYDTDNDAEDINERIILWYIGGVYNSAYDNQTIIYSDNTTEGDFWQYKIRVFDGYNYSLEYTSILIIIGQGSNTPPTVTSFNITLNPYTTGDLIADYDYYDDDGHLQVDYEICWYLNGILQPTLNHSLVVDYALTAKNQEWNYSLRVFDGLNWSIQYNSDTVTILNSPPTVQEISITSSPTTVVNLTAAWVFNDPDNDIEVDYIISWYIDGSYNSTYDNLTTIPFTATTKGEVWNYTLQVFDGETYSSLYSSSAVTIRNTPPTASALTLTANPTTADNIVANWVYNDLDNDPQNLNWIIRWYRNGIYIPTLDDTKTVSSGNTTKNEFWYYILQVYDSENYSKSYTSPNQQILNTAPEITGQVTINPSNPVRGTALSVNYTFYDQDNDFEYGTVIRWYRNGLIQSTYNDLSLVQGEAIVKGDTWYVIVNVSDGTDIGVGVSSSAVIIGNTAPQVDTIEVFPTGTVYTTNTLVANYEASDVDNDLILNFTIIWKIGATPVPALENKTEVPANYTSKGQYWTYEIRVFDGTDWSDPIEPAFGVIIDNSKPVVTNVVLTGGFNTTDVITLFYDFIDLDNDTEDAGQTVITWYNPNLISGPTGKTLSNTYFVAGDFIFVTIIPHDGEDAGDPIITTTYPTGYIFVGNCAPEIIGNPNILGPNQSLVYSAATPLYVNYSAQDIDNDSSAIYDIELDGNGLVVGAEYLWYRNNVLVSGLTSYMVPFEYLTKGEKWTVSVRPRDRYGAFGAWVNSSEIEIGNSWPEIASLIWSIPYPTVQTNLTFIYTYYDFDSDPEWLNQTQIQWFRNSIEIISAKNQSALSNLEFIRGDKIYVQITVFDGKNYSIPYQSGEITILNALPIAQNISFNPSEAYTTSILYLTWNYTDADNDPENNDTIIYWYRNGLLVPEHANKTTLEAQYIQKGEIWYIEFQIFDGLNYSFIYSTSSLKILNSPSSIINVTINSGSNQTYADTSLVILPSQDISIVDPDQDPLIAYIIHWYINDIYQPQYDNQTSIPVSEISKGQEWYANVSVYDGEIWSEFNTSSFIYIINKPSSVSNVEFIFDVDNSQVEPDIRDTVPEQFYVEDEDIVLHYQFLDIDDDQNLTHIQWFKKAADGSLFKEVSDYENQSTMPSGVTSPGDEWYCIITPYDGYDFSSQFTSSIIVIESRPSINKPVIIPDPTNEGSYDISVEVTNQRYPIHQVIFFLTINGSSIDSYYGINEIANNWTLHFELSDYNLLNTIITVEVKAISRVINSDFKIFNTTFFSLEVIDEAPPRVINAYFQKNDDLNPTELTFFVLVEEYGSGIDEVLLYYYFAPFENGGTGSSLFQENFDWLSVQMEYYSENATGVYKYTATVEYVNDKQNMDIIYKIQTSDLDRNINLNAFDIRNYPQQMDQQRIYYQPPGLPSWILLVAGLVIVLVFMGAFAYVKFIRKPELVGLDKELVLTNIEKISEPEIIEALDEHTIGIVASFFDQRHGPIPIIVDPEILKDNFTKLVELSDRSFSGTGFSDDFTVEIPSSYDFVLTQGLRVSVMSFGFSLERPNARGGQENITLNILIHGEIFPLVQSFQKEIQQKIHLIHENMDNNPEDKNQIHFEVSKLRKYISSIVLSYTQIYGTTELLEDAEE